MSSRAQLDSAQYKLWPSSQDFFQPKMATTSHSSHRHRSDSRTDNLLATKSKRHDHRSSTAGDLFTSKATKATTSKINGYHSSPSAEYIAKSSVPSSSGPQHQEATYHLDPYDPRTRVSSSRPRDPMTRSHKSSHGKSAHDPYLPYSVPMSSAPSAATSHTTWLPNPESKLDAPRKHRSRERERDRDGDRDKDRDRDRVRDDERGKASNRDYESERSRDKVRDPYERGSIAHRTATLGRNFKQRTEENAKQPKASSSHRRHHTDDETQRIPRSMQPAPALLSAQTPQPPASNTIVPEVSTRDTDAHRTRNRDNRSYSPPPAPLVAPVWLPERDKARGSRSKSHRSEERAPASNQHSGPSGSDTEREQRSTRNEHRSHQREAFVDSFQASKNTSKKESKISLTGWFSRKPPKVPVESPTMPTPASVFFSPLPERSIPPPHLVSLSAGQGPSDPHHPYLHQDSLRMAASGRPESSRKHSRSQSASQLPSKATPVGTSNSREPNDISSTVRSQSAAAQYQTYSDVPLNTVQASSSAGIPRSLISTVNRHRTSLNVSSSVAPVDPTPIRSHQYHASVPFVSQSVIQTQTHHSDHGHTHVSLNKDQTHAMPSSSQPELSVIQPHHELVDNAGYQTHTSVPPRRPTASSIPASSQNNPSRAKHSGSQTMAFAQSTVPQAVSTTATTKVIPDADAQYQSNFISSYAPPPDDLRDRIHNATPSTTKHNVQSPQPETYTRNALNDRGTAEMGHSSKRVNNDLYPPGYALVGSSAPRDSGNPTHEVKKPTKSKPSPPPVTTVMSGESMSKVDVYAPSDRAVGKRWSISPNASTPSSSYLRADGEGHGPSSTIASPGVSTPSQSSPGRRPSSVQPTSRHQHLQVPPGNDSSLRHSGITTAQQPGSRPSPKRSPSGSHMTVPVHSAQPSPSRSINSHDVYLLATGTPSSSSTVMQLPTTRTKSSPASLKEPLLQPPDTKGQTWVMNGGTSGHSPNKSTQSRELPTGPQGSQKGSWTPTTVPADIVNTLTNDARSKSRSHTYEHPQHPTPIRSSAEPVHGVTRRPSNSSLHATPNPHRRVQSPPPNRHDHVLQGYASTQSAQPGEGLREQVASLSSKATQHVATSGEPGSRSRKRTTSQSAVDTTTVTPGIDPPRMSTSRGLLDPQSIPTSNRHREKPVDITSYPTIPAADIPSHLHRTASDNVYPGSSTQSASQSRNTANSHPNVSLPYSSVPAPAAASVSSPFDRHSTRPPVTSGDSRPSLSGSQPARIAIAGRLSTPAPTADQLPPPTPAQEAELLMTPSSLAPTLKPSYTTARPSSAQSSQESKKKGGLFSIFRSISSSTKQKEAPTPAPVAHHAEQKAAKLRRSSSSKRQGDVLEATKLPGSSTTRVIALPPTVHQSAHAPVTAHAQDRRVSPPKGFHPWKLLSRRHRTVSSASVEALDGTGTGTHVNTPDDSVRSSNTSGIYPALRDPMEATEQWIDKEETDFIDRGTWRRRRPGVTFEVTDDRVDSEIRSRPQRSSKLR